MLSLGLEQNGDARLFRCSPADCILGLPAGIQSGISVVHASSVAALEQGLPLLCTSRMTVYRKGISVEIGLKDPIACS